MTEKEILAKIKLLRDIKPRKDWVVLTKSRILGQEELSRDSISIMDLFLFRWKPALVTPILMFMVVFGLTFSFSQSSVPGDFLYPVKKMTESAQVTLSPENERSRVHLELANRRLEDLNKIAKANRVENLAPTIKEFQANVSEAAKDLVKLEVTTSSDPTLIQEIVSETKKLEENKQIAESLGIVVGDTEELDSALAQLVEREIRDLESRTLTEDQQELLKEAKKAFEAGNFTQALEKLLLLNNQ